MPSLPSLPAAPALLLLAGIFFLNFICRIILAPLLPGLEISLSITHGQAGTFFLCISLGYFISMLCSGFVSARLNHKRTIVCSLLAIGLSMAMISLSPSLFLLRVSFLLLGISSGLYLPSAVAVISDLYQPHQLGRAFGIHEIAPNLAFLSAPLLAAWLQPGLHWQQITGILALAATSAAIIYGLIGRGSNLQGIPPDFACCRELISLPEFRLMVILFSMGICATHGVYSVLPTFLVSVHGMEEQAANMLVGLSRSTTLLTAFFGGWLADRFGARKTMTMVMLLTGLLTALLGISPLSILPVWIWLQPLAAVCFFAPAFSILSRIGSPRARNIVISLAIPIAYVIGSGMIPALVTRLADHGFFSLGLVLSGLFIAGGSLLLQLLQAGDPRSV
jgi:NNP family nitrate/nitrite transporter-like MFS transporter